MQTRTPQRRRVNFRLTISSLRCSMIYKPLASILVCGLYTTRSNYLLKGQNGIFFFDVARTLAITY
jgi:hypothetical protein